ncbi:MAG: DUF6020 family protein [Lachnospiraceae bacterium]|nr:DUF6020 family protein [Lachnospiraceae bacterium]
MKSKMDRYIRIILSIIFTILIQVNIDMNVLPEESFYGKDKILEIFLLAIFYSSFSIWENNKTQYKKWSLIIAGILAGFYVLGYNISRYNDLFSSSNDDWMFGKLFLKWLVYWYCFSTILLFIYIRLERIKYLNIGMKIKNTSNIVRQVCIMSIFVICWSPALICNFPGILYADSWNQLYQAVGIESLSTHHSITHTLFLKLCMTVCQDIESGIVLYTISSFITIIAILSYIINIMIKEDFDVRIIVVTIFIYVLFPSISMFAITVAKDGWFAAFVGLFLMELYILAVKCKGSGKNLVGLLIAAMGVALFRKNGVYLLVFTGIYILVYMCKEKARLEKVFIVLLCAVGIGVGVEWLAVSLFNVKPGSQREMLSLPIQQMARIEKNVRNLDDETRAEIDSFYKNGNLGEAYYPLISDHAKELFDDKSFTYRKREFVGLSFRLFLRYPEESLEAFMCNSFGYWYPIRINWFYAENNGRYLNIEAVTQKHEYPWNVNYVHFDKCGNTAGCDLFCSIAIIFWFFILAGGYLIANKEYGKLLMEIPMAALWLTSVASPVYNELRYVLAIYMALPIICQLIVIGNVDSGEKSLSKLEN